MALENNRNYGRDDRNFNSGDPIISETMETQDPAINQHKSTGRSYDSDLNERDRENHDENDTSDPHFQKNAEIAQDLDTNNSLDTDPDRRTLDEYDANSDTPEEDDEDEFDDTDDDLEDEDFDDDEDDEEEDIR
ncbi:hypothetical protein [Flavobacterium foetidum]|uniref:hypothetical protein n=1 Tax=Flavobacterium foetidum TaxID=2026681 RepID=UPI0013C3649F|nr:hypothetical protein [Flavobacterium foetidum]KAF2516959.1 hypothetical protein E0W73_03365 [Flavobacterium foetidum]